MWIQECKLHGYRTVNYVDIGQRHVKVNDHGMFFMPFLQTCQHLFCCCACLHQPVTVICLVGCLL